MVSWFLVLECFDEFFVNCIGCGGLRLVCIICGVVM